MRSDAVMVDSNESSDEMTPKSDLMDGVLNRCNDIEAVGEEAVEIAIDTTLDAVVDWLIEQGHTDLAEDVQEAKYA